MKYERWSSEWMRKIESRLQRAIYRVIKDFKTAEHPEAAKRIERILLHAEKLKWISIPSSEELALTKPSKLKNIIEIKITKGKKMKKDAVYSFRINECNYVVWQIQGTPDFIWTKDSVDLNQELFGSLEEVLFNLLHHLAESTEIFPCMKSELEK